MPLLIAPTYILTLWRLFTDLLPTPTYFEVVLPCWECNDYEAAILHETGHFFGIGHPNAIPDNLYSAEMLAQFGNSGAASAHPNNTYNSLLASGWG